MTSNHPGRTPAAALVRAYLKARDRAPDRVHIDAAGGVCLGLGAEMNPIAQAVEPLRAEAVALAKRFEPLRAEAVALAKRFAEVETEAARKKLREANGDLDAIAPYPSGYEPKIVCAKKKGLRSFYNTITKSTPVFQNPYRCQYRVSEERAANYIEQAGLDASASFDACVAKLCWSAP